MYIVENTYCYIPDTFESLPTEVGQAYYLNTVPDRACRAIGTTCIRHEEEVIYMDFLVVTLESDLPYV